MAEDKLFYVGQKAFIRRDNKILVLTNSDHSIDYPGGKMQEGELDFSKALKREVREETNLEIEVGNPFTTWYWDFRPGHKNEGKQVFIVGFKCKYLSGEVKLSREHNEFHWVDKEDYKDLDDGTVYFKELTKYFAGT